MTEISVTWQGLQDSFLQLDPDQGAEKKAQIDKTFEGVLGLAKALGTDVLDGIPASECEDLTKRKAIFGENRFATPPLATYWELFLETFKDPILCILLGAVGIALIVGLIDSLEHGWIEAVAIFIAVLVVSNVCAASDYNKQLQFEELYKRGEVQECSLMRGGKVTLLDKSDIVVGDVVKLKTGDKVPADGVIIPGTADSVAMNEADLTGESTAVTKTEGEDIYLHADTFVITGVVNILVVAVGKDTLTGKIKEELMESEEEETPLQEKLGIMAELIGYVGMAAAILTLIALCARHASVHGEWSWTVLLEGFIVAVTIVVVAVPEGLPLAVTIALAYSMGAMYKENIFVKVLSACETMGGATCIASDKTGTLTTGKMSVAVGWIGAKVFEPPRPGEPCVPELPDGDLRDLFTYSIAVNTDAQVTHEDLTEAELAERLPGDTSTTKVKRIGNITECALLMMLDSMTTPGAYLEHRKELEAQKLKVKGWPFDSAKKRMSILVKRGGGEKLFVKGAAEQVLELCTKCMMVDSSVTDMDDNRRREVEDFILDKSARGFRLLAIAYKDMKYAGMEQSHYTGTKAPDDSLTLLAVMAIMDPLRPEVPDAVAACKEAGVKVIMVTGDHLTTATYIASQCGIHTEGSDGVVMEASDFRSLYDRAFLAQHGTRLKRYVRRTEKATEELDSNGKPVMQSTIQPYLDDTGEPVRWQHAIGPCCGKEPRHIQVGQKDKADVYEGFPSGMCKGNPKQLDEWAYGVKNIYDPTGWPQDVQTKVDQLRKTAVRIWLEEDAEVRLELVESFRPQAEKVASDLMQDVPAAAEACQKLGLLVLPPADFLDAETMALSSKERDAIDGGPKAAVLWRIVDEKLFSFENDLPTRRGGLQVLARSLPDDKMKLVRRLMKCDEIVGVTGDGTNDAPALRNANVGMAMGSGTQVARDAADITILDDNFVSIVNAIKWGRNIFDNIRKFLQFQLTVNLVALTLTFVMSCYVDGNVSDELPLNAVQLLWVNLIMDSMGALALATEKPTNELLKRPPHGKERLLSIAMIRMNICQATFQLILLFILASDAPFIKDFCDGCNFAGNNCCDSTNNWSSKVCTKRQNTLVFNAFVFCQFWNEINCRKLKELNVFERFFDSWWFSGVLVFTFFLQAFMVEVAGDFAGTNGLNLAQWGMCIVLGFASIPVGFLGRLIPIQSLELKYGFGRDVGDADEDEDDDDDEEEEDPDVSANGEEAPAVGMSISKKDTFESGSTPAKIVTSG